MKHDSDIGYYGGGGKKAMKHKLFHILFIKFLDVVKIINILNIASNRKILNE